jgi:hypothetical protein
MPTSHPVVPAGTAPQPHLRRLCQWVRALVLLGAVAQLAVLWHFWASPEWIARAAPQMTDLAGHAITLDARARWLGAASSLLPLAIGWYGLWQLWRLFGHYARGLALTAAAQQSLRRFAWAVLLMAPAGPMFRAALGVVLTLGNPPGQRVLAIGISSNDYLLLLLGAVLLAIATVMAEAVRAVEENKQFV